jgi:hypothetical protein
MEPIEPMARHKVPLTPRLQQINFEGACVIAAHQHLVKQGLAGYVDVNGTAAVSHRQEYLDLGSQLIEAAIQL